MKDRLEYSEAKGDKKWVHKEYGSKTNLTRVVLSLEVLVFFVEKK